MNNLHVAVNREMIYGIIQTQRTENVFTRIYKRLIIRRPHYRIASLNDICHLLGFDNFV